MGANSATFFEKILSAESDLGSTVLHAAMPDKIAIEALLNTISPATLFKIMTSENEGKHTLLHLAALHGNMTVVKKLEKACPPEKFAAFLNAEDARQNKASDLANSAGQNEVVEFLSSKMSAAASNQEAAQTPVAKLKFLPQQPLAKKSEAAMATPKYEAVPELIITKIPTKAGKETAGKFPALPAAHMPKPTTKPATKPSVTHEPIELAPIVTQLTKPATSRHF